VDFSCTSSSRFCPNVPSVITCETTNAVISWDITGDVTGSVSFSVIDPVGTTTLVTDGFIAIKTDVTSFSLNFSSQVEFNNSVIVTCNDLNDVNPNSNDESCTIMNYGKKL